MTEQEFKTLKPGDKVECIDDSDMSLITKGREYIIRNLGNGNSRIIMISSDNNGNIGSYCVDRFELVTNTTKTEEHTDEWWQQQVGREVECIDLGDYVNTQIGWRGCILIAPKGHVRLWLDIQSNTYSINSNEFFKCFKFTDEPTTQTTKRLQTEAPECTCKRDDYTHADDCEYAAYNAKRFDWR